MDYSRLSCACADCLAHAASSADPQAAGGAWGANAQTSITYPYTGDYRVDVLLDGDPDDGNPVSVDYRWNHDQPLGTNKVITYSFMGEVPWYGGNHGIPGAKGFMPFTGQQMAATRQIMQRLSAEIGVDLLEVSDSASTYGQIRLGNNNQNDAQTAGYAWLPNSTFDDASGDVWLDFTYSPNMNLTPGGIGYATLLHEIGHALGLKHPGGYNAGDDEPPGPGNFLGSAEDNYAYTVMSYNSVDGNQERDWFGMYDLLALKRLYGTGTLNAGNTQHAFSDTDGAVLKIIDDASGIDTLDLSALSVGAVVDLRPGGFSSIGRNGFFPASNNLTIDLETQIEHVVATNQRDWITLGPGSLSADGRGQTDTVVYAGPRSHFQASASGAVVSVSGAGMQHQLSNVERLHFTDSKLAFDFNGAAGMTAKILGAVFGQGSDPIAEYASAGIAAIDSLAHDYLSLMQAAIDYRLGAHTHADLVTLLYENVGGFTPSAEDLQYWTGQLQNGTYTQASLGVFVADSVYNAENIELVAQMQTGLAYL